MDYQKQQFFNEQFAVPKMPFYMSYPMQNLYLTEMEYEKDMERMKELYPREVRRILEYVEDECDKMEYDGSLMFDEYPDRLMLEMLVNKILKRVEDEGQEAAVEQYRGDATQGQGVVQNSGNHLRELIGVILNNEMYRRRCRHRRCRRWW